MGSVTEHKFDVYLYIYDLSRGSIKLLSRQMGFPVDAIWHTSVVVYGKEFYFGSHGIQVCEPGKSEVGQPLETLHLGVTYISLDLFKEYLRNLSQSKFQNVSYHLFNNNCNNFTQELANFLCSTNIPDYILELPNKFLNSELGRAAAPLLESIALGANKLPINQATSTIDFFTDNDNDNDNDNNIN